MTETLHHPTDPKAEQLAHVEKQLRSIRSLSNEAPIEHNNSETHAPELLNGVTLDYENGTNEDRPVSPLAERIRNAADRLANRLEKRSVAKAHDAALKEYRSRDIEEYSNHVDRLSRSDAEYADHYKSLQQKEDRIADREEFIEGATLQLRALGSLAMDKTSHAAKEAGLMGVGLGVMGYKAARKRIDPKIETAKFRHEMNAGRRSLNKEYVKEVKQHEKTTKREAKQLDKTEKQRNRVLLKDDRRFEREMRKKASSEKWSARKEALIVKAEKGAYKAGEAYRSTVDTYERVRTGTQEKKRKIGAFALKARDAGSAAVAAGRQEFKK